MDKAVTLMEIWATLLFFLFVYELVRTRQMIQKRVGTLLSLIGTAVAFTVAEMLLTGADIPLWASAVILAVLSISAAAHLTYIIRMQLNEITLMSIKECFDTLPSGLCFYRKGGIPQLVNPAMDSLCKAVTGQRLSDAESFWEKLKNAELPESIRGGEQPMISLGGKAYSFVRYEAETDGEPIYEIVASDISEEKLLNEELRTKQKHSAEINRRLKALNSTLKYVIMEKEVLQMKVRIHDELGQALLMAKRFVHDKESCDRAELLDIWQNSVRLLKSERRENWQKPYFVNLQRAALLGIEVIIDGKLPEDSELIPVIDTAIAVHTTNVLRHAEGDKVFICVKEDEKSYEITFRNNGKPPKYGVKETGGLANLRREAEGIGGGMKLRALPEFEITLRLPRGEVSEEALLWHTGY